MTMTPEAKMNEFQSNLDHVQRSKAAIRKNFIKSLKTPTTEQVAKSRPEFDIPGIEMQTITRIAKMCGIDDLDKRIEKSSEGLGVGGMTAALYTIIPVLTERFGYALQNQMEINEALTLFPISSVTNDRAKWYSFDSKDASRTDPGYMAEFDGTTAIKIGQSTKSYETRLRGKHVLASEEFKARAQREGGFGVVGFDDMANDILAQWVALTRINAYLSILFETEANGGFTEQAVANGGGWYTNGNYDLDIAAAAKAIRKASFGTVSKRDLTVGMTLDDWTKVKYNSVIQDFVVAGGSTDRPAIMSEDQFAAHCGVKRLVIVDAWHTTGTQTEDGTGGDFVQMVQPGTAVVYYDDHTPTGPFVKSAVANFACSDLPGLNGQGIRSYPFNPTVETIRADAIAVNVKDGPTRTNPELGISITGINA